MKDNNIGQTGLDSIRINNMKIDNLPLGQGNAAREGLSAFLKTDKETKKNNILAKFPKHKADFLESQVKECKNNIKKIKEFKSSLKDKITEYRQLISDCDFREKEIEKYNKDNPEEAKKIKELRLQYPPYDVDALSQQIDQFHEAVDRCDEVIEQEYESINEIHQILVLVKQREMELRNI